VLLLHIKEERSFISSELKKVVLQEEDKVEKEDQVDKVDQVDKEDLVKNQKMMLMMKLGEVSLTV